MIKFLSVLMLGLATLTACNQKNANAEASFKVWGNCKMCKKTIETSLKDKAGIAEAAWDVKTKQMKVSFDTAQIKLQDIQQYIAAAGYDNEGVRGNDQAYAGLHECCKYDRAPLSAAPMP